MGEILGLLPGLIFGFFLFIYPFILTILNILVMCSKKEKLYDKRRRYTKITLIYGFILYQITVLYMSSFKWDESVVLGGGEVPFHEPFSEDAYILILIIQAVSIISMLLLDRTKMMPPLAASLCVCNTYAGLIIFIFSFIQVMKLLELNGAIFVYISVYMINFVLCLVRIISEVIKDYSDYFKNNDMSPRCAVSRKTAAVLSKVSGWFIFPILCLIPLTAVLVCISIIFGQGPDGIIKAFTETSDWTFSRMISPPPIQYKGHYLCTVAVNGHEKVVKPTRLGIRQETKIVVNRQLCVANAFEQLIEDKAPRFHRFVRYIYDKYGYPVSKHITTKFRADVIYIIMKPLEWVFIIALYLFDVDPENRIALQYTGRYIKEFKTYEK